MSFAQEPPWSSGWIANSFSPEASGCPARKIRTTTSATITMCHQTLTWFSRATTLMPPMFRPSWMSMITPIVTSWPVSHAWPKTAVVLL